MPEIETMHVTFCNCWTCATVRFPDNLLDPLTCSVEALFRDARLGSKCLSGEIHYWYGGVHFWFDRVDGKRKELPYCLAEAA